MLLSKQELVRELKSMCLPHLNELCEKAGLSEQQKRVILARINTGIGVEQASYDLGMCETCVKNHFRIGIDRILDYKNFTCKKQTSVL